jgi:steroid 5-alpha reductase family enzyme
MNYFLVLALILLAYMSAWFGCAILRRRNDLADVAWGLGFVLLAWLALLIAGQFTYRAIVIDLLISIWGFRLAWHIYRRNRGKSEDYRYATWRQQWGRWFLIRSYLQVFLLQGLFLYLISLPVFVINRAVQPTKLHLSDYLGLLIWIIGFFFETVGDAQLAKYKAQPENKGKLMQSGLWRYTRHPNYFGEVTMWWGIWLGSLSIPGSWFTVIGPITITYLILKVSGIPLLEQKYAGRPDFEAYRQRTSAFFPLPPRRK